MSGTSLGRLYVDLLAKTSGFETDMGRAARIADKRAKEIDRSLAKMADRITSGFKGASLAAVGFVAGFASVGQIAGVVKEAIDAADKVDELSARLGVSTEKLSALGYAAKLTGTDLDKIGDALPKLSAKIASGSEIFAEMGIDVEDANGKLRNSADLLPEIADLFKELNNDTLEQALALEIFGKSGAEMLEFLNLGSAGLLEMEERARALGLVLGPEVTGRAAEFNDRLDDLQAVSQGISTEIASGMLPNLSEAVTKLTEMGKAGEFAANSAAVLNGLVGAGVGIMEGYNNAVSRVGLALEVVVGFVDGLNNAQRGLLTFDYERVAAGWERIASSYTGAQSRLDQMTADGANADKASLFANVTTRVTTMTGREQRIAQARADRRRNAEDRLLNGTFGAKAGGSAKRGTSAVSEETRAYDQLVKTYESLIDRQGERLAQLGAELETGGKLGEAWRVAYDMQSGAMAELAEKAKKDLEPWQKLQALINAETEDQLALQAELRGKQADDAERFGEYLASLDREHEALGLSNLELQVRNAQLGAGIKLTAEQAAAIEASVLATEKAERMVGALDGVRDITQDLFYDMPNGAAEAWENAIDQIEARLWQWAASGVLDQLFGESGTTGKGSVFGDLFGSIFNSSDGSGFGGIFASVFGGGRAIGGPVTGGKLYEVTERGLPELLSIGDRQLLMMPPGRAGMVTPMAPARGGRSGATTINHFHLGAPTERRTQDQIAGRVHFQGTRSTLRNS